MATLTEQLKKIEDDIIVVLMEKRKAMTADQLINQTKLQNMSWFGWSFAIENLIKKNRIKVSGHDRQGYLQYTLIKKKAG